MEEHKSSKGLWKACYQLEISAALTLNEVLKVFDEPIENLYECGVEVATLKKKVSEISDGMKVGGMFLKRCLTDLRAIWSLLQIGYTSQAGCIAAAAFESALIVEAISNNDERARQIMNNESGDAPWSVVNLCKFHADQAREEAEITKKNFSEKEYEVAWMQLYGAYKWLCKIKHPTLPSALHDIGTASLKAEEYVIMAVPDIREEDTPNKYIILTIVISRIRSAIRNLAFSSQIDFEDDGVKAWLQRFNSIITDTLNANDISNNNELPFVVTDKKLQERFKRHFVKYTE